MKYVTSNLNNEENNIEKFISNTFLQNLYGVKGVGYGFKSVNNIPTEEKAIIFVVENKKTREQIIIDSGVIIPSSIYINNSLIPTDVIEDQNQVMTLSSCYDFSPNTSAINLNYEIRKLRKPLSGDSEVSTLLLPIKSGQEVIRFPDGGNKGTLGFLCVDKEDNKIIGITNAHVACHTIFRNSDRNITTEFNDPYNFVDQRGSNNTVPALIVGYNDTNAGNVYLSMNLKRYSPIIKNATVITNSEGKPISFTNNGAGFNYIDVCLFDINSNLITANWVTNNSYQIHQPVGTQPITTHFDFATTAEIDSLLDSPGGVYSVGKTTGAKGWSGCELQITNINMTIAVGHKDRNSETTDYYLFNDVIEFQYSDGSNYPLWSGDSGSIVLKDFNGVLKIIGLGFSGTENKAYACRIDKIVQILNIEPWLDNTTVNFSIGTKTEITRPYSDPDVDSLFIEVNGVKYWNVGLRASSAI